jgi:hypothetical protein
MKRKTLDLRNLRRPADGIGEAHAELRFDPSAIGAEAFGL